MPSLQSGYYILDLSPDIAVANTNELTVKGVPIAGRIVQIQLGINTILTTGGGTLAIAKGSTNVLSASTINLGAAATPDLVAATPEDLTLATAAKTLHVDKADILKATWTLTTAAVTNAASLLVVIAPDAD